MTLLQKNLPVNNGLDKYYLFIQEVFTFGSVYMSIPLSHFVPAYPSPSPNPQIHSLVGLCLYSHLAPRFFMTYLGTGINLV